MMVALDALSRTVFSAGTEIFAEGDPGDCAYIVETGLVEVAKATPNGEKILGYVGAGASFGEMALIDGEPRIARATAVKDTVCRVVTAEQFRERMASADPVMRAMLKSLVTDVRSVIGKPAFWVDWI